MEKLRKPWLIIFLAFFLLIPFLYTGTAPIAALLFLGVSVWAAKRLPSQSFPVILFAAACVLRIAICLILETPPVSDFRILLDASESLAQGDTSFLSDSYFETWPYQMGFVFVQSLILKISDSVLFLKTVNCLVSAGICVLVYLISRTFLKEEYAKACAVFYTFLPFSLTYVTVLTNQHLSAFFIYLGIYVLVKERFRAGEIMRFVTAGILTAFGNIIRPEGIVTVLSVILFLVLSANRTAWKRNLAKAAALAASYFLVLALAGNLFAASGISPDGLKNNAPYWKFVLGFNYETGGQYSGEDAWVLEEGMEEEGWQLVRERVCERPDRIAELFLKKVNIFWNTSPLGWSFGHLNENNAVVQKFCDWLDEYETWGQFLSYILAAAGTAALIRKSRAGKKRPENVLILINQVFVTFGVYLLIEIQPRYVYFVQISVFMLAGMGIQVLAEKGKKIQRAAEIGEMI